MFKKDDIYMIIVLDFFIVKRVSVFILNIRYRYVYRYKIYICRKFRVKCVCVGNEVSFYLIRRYFYIMK